MNIPCDCVFEILRRAGPVAAAACAVVCKQWKRVIFRTRLPIVVFRGCHGDRDGNISRVFTAFVRSRRGYTRCNLIVTSVGEPYWCYNIARGWSPFTCVVPASSAQFTGTMTARYGDYRVNDDAVAGLRATWPDYGELAAILGAVKAY